LSAVVFRNSGRFNRLFDRHNPLPVILIFPLSDRDGGARRLEPPEQVVDTLFLELQASERELHARPGGCHRLHRDAKATYLGQQRGQHVLSLRSVGRLCGETALQRRPHAKARRNQDENADSSSHVPSFPSV
jgi:hypothetical protein